MFRFDPAGRRFSVIGHLPAAVADAKFLAASGRFLSAGGESGHKVRAPWTWAGQVETPQRTVIAFGDSVTLGVRAGLVGPEQTYPGVLGALVPGCRVINAGVGGNDTRHLLARLDRDVLSQRPDLVLVMVGLNDAAYVDPGPVARTAPRVPPDEYRQNLERLVRRIRESGARVLLATPNPMTQAYAYSGFAFYANNGINAALVLYREAVLDAARELQCPVVDLFAAWRDRGDLDRLLVDGIHPGVEGHARIAELLLPAIEGELR